ncbi:hypothetical protein INR49_018095, partial [Caranx melampygus]
MGLFTTRVPILLSIWFPKLYNLKWKPAHHHQHHYPVKIFDIRCDSQAVGGTGADQSTAQDQDVEADDARQEPSTTMVGPLHHHSHMVDSTFSRGLHTGR